MYVISISHTVAEYPITVKLGRGSRTSILSVFVDFQCFRDFLFTDPKLHLVN